MGISKVNFGGDTLIDLTNDSVTADMLVKGATAHDAAGEQVVGTFEPALIVTVTKNTDGIFSADKTNQEIYEAFQKGIYIEARRPDLEMVYKLYDVPNAGKASFVSTMMDSASGSAIGYDTIKINSNAVTYQSVNSNVLIGNTDELTPEQVYTAVSSGRPVKIQHTSSSYGVMSFTAFNIAETMAVIASQNIVFYGSKYILAELGGYVQSGGWFFNSAVVVTNVDSALSATSTNPVENKVITSALEGKAGTEVATASTNGLMSKEDKTKLDGVEDGATKTIVDTAMSDASTNPVQNKVLKKYIDDHSAGTGGAANAVQYTAQTLDKAQQGQARTNIGAVGHNSPQFQGFLTLSPANESLGSGVGLSPSRDGNNFELNISDVNENTPTLLTGVKTPTDTDTNAAATVEYVKSKITGGGGGSSNILTSPVMICKPGEEGLAGIYLSTIDIGEKKAEIKLEDANENCAVAIANLRTPTGANTSDYAATKGYVDSKVPTALKNPNALTIKIGSTTVTYDGSTAQTVTIDDGTEVSY
jgi:hypothetical protein